MYRRSSMAAELADPSMTATAAVLPDPPPLPTSASGWIHWLGLAISGAVLVAILDQLRSLDFARIAALLPASAAFWAAYWAYYMSPIASEWLIFRRLWRIPPSGFIALTRKFIGNEVLLGYIGEVYFYAWARKRSRMTGAPFGAIKDVAILSALVGNVVTLAMMALAYPIIGELRLGLGGSAFYLSAFALAATSLAALLLRRRVFSLPADELRFVVIVHLARILATTGLAALMWYLVLPHVPLGWWLLLAALRLLLSRLPFLPNKDLAFVALAMFAIGQDSQITALLTMVASLILATHVLLGLLLASAELSGLKERI